MRMLSTKLLYTLSRTSWLTPNPFIFLIKNRYWLALKRNTV
jgi:hypothetical protein